MHSKFVSEYTINIGLLQGSVFSPLLFSIYILMILFLSRNMSTTNNELITYREWTNAHRLSLSVNKTHVVFFINKPIPYQPQIAYHQQILNLKEKCTFLVVILDNELKFSKYIQIIGKNLVDVLVLYINSKTWYHLIF